MTKVVLIVTICNNGMVIQIFDIFGGVLASTWYVSAREHVERCLCARKLSSQTISAETKAQFGQVNVPASMIGAAA